MKKIIVVINLIIMLLCFNVAIVNAAGLDDIMHKGENFVGASTGDRISEENMKAISNYVFPVLSGVAVAAAVIVAIILGIKFMTGSMEQQAKIKEMIVPYVVGCFVAFAAFGIWKLIVNLLQNSGI